MKRLAVLAFVIWLQFGGAFAVRSHAQTTNRFKSQEVSETDGIPVLMKHLPNWEVVRPQAVFATDLATLRSVVGQRPLLDLIDFSAGTEAVTAHYPAGRLLIVEYTNPQASIEADTNFNNFLAQNNHGRTVYKRIGNYNVFVFDATDEAAANILIDEVRYEKNVHWLGEDPFLFQRLERDFVVKTTDLFLSTVGIIVIGMVGSLIGGLITGYFFFQIRERKRHSFKQFSDAGGMTRLNLDGFTPDISSNKLLSDS